MAVLPRPPDYRPTASLVGAAPPAAIPAGAGPAAAAPAGSGGWTR